jgi:hypothetical protein
LPLAGFEIDPSSGTFRITGGTGRYRDVRGHGDTG